LREDVTRLMETGVSVVVRAAERNDPGLARLAERFERVLPGEVHVQLYATPAGTNSYGWHYDFEDVFIAQTAGVKDYYFRANTVALDAVLGDRLDFGAFANERSPLMSARLIAGDWLYLPARWWHLVKCATDSLSISIGVMSPAELRRAHRLPAGWTGERRAGELGPSADAGGPHAAPTAAKP
jgi:50S ribosomal protein L16 3-hydroxylase